MDNVITLIPNKQPVASLFVISSENHGPMVTIDQDGNATIHNEDQVNEAAKIFWRAVEGMNPQRGLLEENKRLKALLEQVNDDNHLDIPAERVDLYEHHRWRDDIVTDYIVTKKGANIGEVGNNTERKEIVAKHNAALRSLIINMGYAPGIPPKPFTKPGAWFPTDVMGHPMIEYAPGQWDNYLRPLPFESVRINPDFWIQQIRTTMYTTDCPAKVQVLENCANHLERYLEMVKPFVKEAPHDPGSLCSSDV